MKAHRGLGGVVFAAAVVCAAATLLVAAIAPSVRGNPGIVLTPIAIDFDNPVGIDHHEPDKKVVLSVNYPDGQPYNFELVDADGTRAQFSSISGLTEELKIGAVRKGCCQGGFEVGELLTGTGVPGVIARISPDGTAIQNPWVTLPSETGLMRGSLFQDRFCVCGGELIVATTAGNVWRVSAGGTPTKLASLGTHLEGLTTVPNDPKYGPWAGKILVGAENALDPSTQEPGLIFAIDCAEGGVEEYGLGIRPEDIDIIPANQNFFGVDFGGATLWGAAPSEFAGMVGDVLIAQEGPPGILWDVRWDGSTFQKTEIARVTQWEHVTFSTAGLPNILPVEPLLLEPPSAENPAGTGHTVTATIDDPGDVIPAGRLLQFEVIDGPNQGQKSDSGECALNSDCTTDNDQVSWTYTSNGQLGIDTIEACFADDDCTQHCTRVTKTWKDLTPPVVDCIETVNPHGKKVPPAGKTTLPGPKGGQNDDGFYRLMAEDDLDADPGIFVMDLGSGTVFGAFSSGTNIKYTEANGATPGQKKIGSDNGQAGAVAWHITGSGDAAVYSVDDAGNRSDLVFCLVPPPPK